MFRPQDAVPVVVDQELPGESAAVDDRRVEVPGCGDGEEDEPPGMDEKRPERRRVALDGQEQNRRRQQQDERDRSLREDRERREDGESVQVRRAAPVVPEVEREEGAGDERGEHHVGEERDGLAEVGEGREQQERAERGDAVRQEAPAEEEGEQRTEDSEGRRHQARRPWVLAQQRERGGQQPVGEGRLLELRLTEQEGGQRARRRQHLPRGLGVEHLVRVRERQGVERQGEDEDGGSQHDEIDGRGMARGG